MNSPSVIVREESIVIPTYEPLPPDKNPLFLEKRVYQGSSGKVYPLPFIDRISEKKINRTWKGIWIENKYIRLLILPEIGGRIHIGQDKSNGYDFFYRQNVIKPALVGLAGPWISGGVEFNWPQHHRPATFMSVDYEIEEHEDGSKTIWCSDHDPMVRMKGMHGICLHPEKAFVELKVRAYNRTPFTQTFLWWANVATRVHEQYQSFFPPDVSYVADHAKRAMSEFPLCRDRYYGVDYSLRARQGVPKDELPQNFCPPGTYKPNDLSWYANIPVPTSYMAMGSHKDFFGGYDHLAQAGLVHVANHHISPGKKQWTWGNHEFGYAWDRHLTETDGPYIELMAGVYTDNQPDFSFLNPGETKIWSQFWYPIQKIGPAHEASTRAALHFNRLGSTVRLGVCVTENFPQSTICLEIKSKTVWKKTVNLRPENACLLEFNLKKQFKNEQITISIKDQHGENILQYHPKISDKKPVPAAATEPLLPAEIKSSDELYLTGLHLEQYRHATRKPELYWKEGLRRDSGDARCHHALGLWHLKRGEIQLARNHFERSIERLTHRNPNPYDGEAYYHLGLTLRYLNEDEKAYAAFYKSTWNMACQAPGYHAIAELDCKMKDWKKALDHLDRSLRMNTENLRALNLKVMVLQKLGMSKEASVELEKIRKMDSLDHWSRFLAQESFSEDPQIRFDIAYDLLRAGFNEVALELLEVTTATEISGTAPLLDYLKAWIHEKMGNRSKAIQYVKSGEKQNSDYCFPSRIEEILILENAVRLLSRASNAFYYLGNLFYDRRRHHEAIQVWEKSVHINPRNATAWRNLGIGYYNILQKKSKSKNAYERAFRLNRQDGRIFYERDQLWKRLRISATQRMKEMERYSSLIRDRDDLCVEYCALLNQTGNSEKALNVLLSRQFQPWEGGEGQALGQFTRSKIALGVTFLKNRNPEESIKHLQSAFQPPASLGEARHLLTNPSDLWYWLGRVYQVLGQNHKAIDYWKKAADFKGDFQNMSVQVFSEQSYYSGLSLKALGKKIESKKLFKALLVHAKKMENTTAKIDYFATSLPTLLLFDEDLQFRQTIHARFLMAQAYDGLGQNQKSKNLLRWILKQDPHHALAADLLRS